MTIKYLYTLRKIGDNSVDKFFVDKVNEFHAPLDSYVLNAIGLPEPRWSKIDDYDTYLERQKKLTFLDEYKNWPVYARDAMKKSNGDDKLADIGSYKRYIQDEEKKGRGYSFK